MKMSETVKIELEVKDAEWLADLLTEMPWALLGSRGRVFKACQAALAPPSLTFQTGTLKVMLPSQLDGTYIEGVWTNKEPITLTPMNDAD